MGGNVGQVGMLVAAAVATYFTAGAAGAALAATEGAAVGAAGVGAAEGLAAGAAMTEGFAAGGALAEGAALASEGAALAEGAAVAGGAGDAALAGAAAADTLAVDAGLAGAVDSGMASMSASPGFVSGSEISALGMPQNAAFSAVPQGGGSLAAEVGAGQGGFTPVTAAMKEAASAGVSDPGFSLGSIVGKDGLVTYGEAGGLAMSGGSAVLKAGASKSSSASQQALLETQRADARMVSAQREASSQDKLARILSRQTVAFFSRGQTPGVGSARAMAEGAYDQGGRDTATLGAEGISNELTYGIKSAALGRSRQGALLGGLFDVGETGYSIYGKRSRIGAR